MLEAVELTRQTRAGEMLLDCINLRVKPAERWCVFGPTGSGKTLLLRALALLDAPDAGEVRWEGNQIADSEVPNYRRKVIYLHQRPALIEGRVEDNLGLPLTFHSARGPCRSRKHPATAGKHRQKTAILGTGRPAAFRRRTANRGLAAGFAAFAASLAAR